MTNPAENNQNNSNSPDDKNEETVHHLDDSMEQAAAENSDAGDEALAAIAKERDEMRDKLMRALAEAENTRKRAEKMQADTTKYAVSGFAKDMLDIADNLRRALDAIPDEQKQDAAIQTIYNGVQATEKIMLGTFEKHGIQKIEPTEGKFDPNFHEVMFETDVPGKEAGEIIQLLEAGYTLHDRLLRPARVGVAKGGNGGSEHKIDTEV
jgi:molecular chaperone GrpE